MERRLTINARLRAVLNTTRPAGCRQPAWTLTDRLIIRLLAWRRYTEFGKAHLVWE